MNRQGLLALLLIIVTLALPGGLALAQGPTPSSTPLPTPTLQFGGLQNTPTMIPIGTPASWFDTRPEARNLADTTINMYRSVNFGGVVDLLIFALFAGLTLRGLFRIMKRAKKLDDA